MTTYTLAMKNRRLRFISIGLCGRCGKFPIHTETSRSYCSVCLEKKRIKAKLYRDANPDKVSKAKKLSVSKNPAKYRNIKKRFWETHKEDWNQYARDRRARKLKVGGNFTKKEWDDLLEFYKHACLKCGYIGKLEADHVVPISVGGKNSIDNIQPLCKKCNREKHKKTIDFRPFGNFILEWT